MKVLILIDIQNDYFPGGKFRLRGMKKAARKADSLAREFREGGFPVVHVRHDNLRPDAKFFLPGTQGAEFHPSVERRLGDLVLTKNYPNSFRATGLQERLGELGVDEIHLAGAMTNMCVDSTARAGFDLGYRVVVRKACCAAPGVLGTKLIHRLFLLNLGSAFAEVR